MNRWAGLVTGIGVFILVLGAMPGNCRAGFTPFRQIAQAAASDEKPLSQAPRKALNRRLRAVLAAEPGLSTLKFTTAVYMGHGFVIGFVSSEQQQDQVINATKGVPVRTLHYYLPLKTAASSESEAEVSNEDSQDKNPAFLVAMQIKGALSQYNAWESLKLKIKVLDNAAILMGIVRNADEHDAIVKAAQGTKDIGKVVDFLLYPEPGREKIFKLPEVPLP
jgi:osmotically-inducible protein OsmY